MKENPSWLVTILVFITSAIFLSCTFAKLHIVRQAGGLKGRYWPWQSTSEMQKIRKALGSDPLGRRMDRLDKISTLSWIVGVLVIVFWQLHSRSHHLS